MMRAALPDDAAEMARLAAELGYPMPPEEMARRVARLTGDVRHHIVVAAEGPDRILGWMHVEHRDSLEGGERAEVMGLVVDSRARGRGIGRTLVAAAEDWASAKGLAELTVRSNTARELSHPFYEALGYERLKTQHVYIKRVSPGSR